MIAVAPPSGQKRKKLWQRTGPVSKIWKKLHTGRHFLGRRRKRKFGKQVGLAALLPHPYKDKKNRQREIKATEY